MKGGRSTWSLHFTGPGFSRVAPGEMGGASLEDQPEPHQTVLHAKEKFMSVPPGHLLQEDPFS